MAGQPVTRPLVCWEGFALRLDLDELETWLNGDVLDGVDAVRDVRLEAVGDALDISVQVSAKGIPARVTVRTRELRLAHRYFGCRIEWVRGPFGLPLPLALLAPLLDRAPRGLLVLDDEERILLVNLGRALPRGLELRVTRASAEGRWLELELGAGCMVAPPLHRHERRAAEAPPAPPPDRPAPGEPAVDPHPPIEPAT